MTGERPHLDIALVSGRRPELLARTLASFGTDLFAGFAIDGVFANIDPVGLSLEMRAEIASSGSLP